MCPASDTDGVGDAYFWEYLGFDPPDESAPQAAPRRQPADPSHGEEPDSAPKPMGAQKVAGEEVDTLVGTSAALAGGGGGEEKCGGSNGSELGPGGFRPISLEEAIQLQDLLIEEYKREEFQDRLHDAWASAKGDACEELRARQAVCLPIQGPVIARFGFEPTRRGVSHSVLAFRPHNWHPEVEDRNLTMQYLVTPPQQNTKWINGFEEPPRWWQRAQRSGPPRPVDPPAGGAADTVADVAARVEAPTVRGAPVSFGPSGGGVAPHSVAPKAGPAGGVAWASAGASEKRRSAASIDDAIDQLSRLQIVLAVPTLERLRASRPLRRFDDEIYVAQFALQSTSRNFSRFLESEEGKVWVCLGGQLWGNSIGGQ